MSSPQHSTPHNTSSNQANITSLFLDHTAKEGGLDIRFNGSSKLLGENELNVFCMS